MPSPAAMMESWTVMSGPEVLTATNGPIDSTARRPGMPNWASPSTACSSGGRSTYGRVIAVLTLLLFHVAVEGNTRVGDAATRGTTAPGRRRVTPRLQLDPEELAAAGANAAVGYE